MITEIYVPKLGMTQGDVTIVEWLKPDGEMIEAGESVVVIETAKVSHEVPAPASGLVFSLKKAKTKIQTGQVVGLVTDSREEFEQYSPGRKKESGGPTDQPGSAADPFEDDEDEWGIRLSFDDEDDQPAQPAAAAGFAPSVQAVAVNIEGRRILKKQPMTGMRRRIADNLMASLHSGAQLTVTARVDMTEFTSFRDELRLDFPEVRVTYVDMLVKLLPVVLKEFPVMNSSIAGDDLIFWDEYNIGVAVALEEGLVVPVVRGADGKGLAAVSREIKKLARRARENALSPDDYQNGTFTLSSGGAVEVELITPIINPPENAILALGRIGPAPAVHEGKLAVRTMTNFCLTHDHRAIDGVPASLFLGRLKEIVETPTLFRKYIK